MIEPVMVDGRLGADEIDSWRQAGFALVDGLFPADLVGRLSEAALARFAAAPVADGPADFGSATGGGTVFPSDLDDFNELVLHDHLLVAAAALLGCEVAELRLTQADLWAKRGHAGGPRGSLDNTDQRIHVDYPNHTLTHPPPWSAPEAVEAIVYLSDGDQCGGATAVVPRRGDDDPAYRWPIVDTPGVGGIPWINDRASAEAWLAQHRPDVAEFRSTHLYPREENVRYRVGTTLLYRHDTWHRGTPIAPGATRVVVNLTIRRAASEWVSTLHEGWAWSAYRPSELFERLIARATIDQRCVLGFPPPGHRWWSPETLAAVEARYAHWGIDLRPYHLAG